MVLEEILRTERQNTDYIFLYKEEKVWYAYEQSAFYCYSLLGVLDIDWLSYSDENSVEQMIIRVRIPEPDKLLFIPSLHLMRKSKTEYFVLCRILCGGFYYWREQQQMKFRILQEIENSSGDK